MTPGRRDRDGSGGTGPAPVPTTRSTRPDPPDGARDLVIVVLDSLRYDSWTAAHLDTLPEIGEVQRRWSYASWTAPSHYNLLMGLLPHESPRHTYASEYYRRDMGRFADRLGVDVDLTTLLPSLFLPRFLRERVGYETHALVSMPSLNPHTPLNSGFDSFTLMPAHNDLAGIVDRLQPAPDRPSFWLVNAGETHYPYAVPGDDAREWPHLSGLHGILRRLDDPEGDGPAFFDRSQLAELRERQVAALEYVDGVIGRLVERLDPGTWLVVTSDHGELFGEDGYFGHGPIAHDKVLEVPLVEGRL